MTRPQQKGLTATEGAASGFKKCGLPFHGKTQKVVIELTMSSSVMFAAAELGFGMLAGDRYDEKLSGK